MRFLLGLTLGFAVACGGSTTVDHGAAGSGGLAGEGIDASPPAGGSGGATGGTGGFSGGTGGSGGAGACASYVPVAPPEAIAKSPRANADAELLALSASNALVASDAIYARVAPELEAIWALEPALASIHPRPPWDPTHLLLQLDDTAWAAYGVGQFHDWDCPNQAYGVSMTQNIGNGSYVLLGFDPKRYDVRKLVGEYQKVPHVTLAEPDYMVGDGPSACLVMQGDVDDYLFDDAGGDCPAGCTTHAFTAYSVAPGFPPAKLGNYDGGASPPGWFSVFSECKTQWNP